jgi:hypothetical protein
MAAVLVVSGDRLRVLAGILVTVFSTIRATVWGRWP